MASLDKHFTDRMIGSDIMVWMADGCFSWNSCMISGTSSKITDAGSQELSSVG